MPKKEKAKPEETKEDVPIVPEEKDDNQKSSPVEEKNEET